MTAIHAAMPNLAHAPVIAAGDGTPLPHAVHLPDLSLRALGERLGPALEACRAAARAVGAGNGWSVSAVYEPGLGASYVFSFACPMASLRFSARAAAATTVFRSPPARWNPG